jgi:hypothetical protein
MVTVPFDFVEELARGEFVLASINGSRRIVAPLFACSLFVVSHVVRPA